MREFLRRIFMMEDPKSCSKCGRPVAPGMKFCETCGAKIETLPTCTKCGAPLAPGMKFCETCGTRIIPAAAGARTPKEEDMRVDASAPPVPEPAPVQKASSRSRPPINEIMVEELKVPQKDAVRISPEPEPAEEKPASAEPAGKTAMTAAAAAPAVSMALETQPGAKHGKSAEKEIPVEVAKVAAAVDVWTSPDSSSGDAGIPKGTGEKKPAFSKTMIIAGVIVLALLSAAVFFVGLPLLNGSGTPPSNPAGAQVTMNPGSPAAPLTTAGTSGTASISLTAGPTQVPPPNLALIIDVERDAITHMITVTFQGGPGQYGVRELVVTLTKSDGTVETKSFKPDNRGTFITLKGTEKADRVEITANYYNGESFKVVDKVFEYKKRIGSI